MKGIAEIRRKLEDLWWRALGYRHRYCVEEIYEYDGNAKPIIWKRYWDGALILDAAPHKLDTRKSYARKFVRSKLPIFPHEYT